MDWNFVYVIAGVCLNIVIFGAWKPWAAGYTGEKGKNLAERKGPGSGFESITEAGGTSAGVDFEAQSVTKTNGNAF